MHPVLVVDFGAQYAQLIARRVREANVYSEIVPHTMSVADMLAKEPAAIILSGGPSSVYEEGAPSVDPAIFEAGVPVLGICNGFQVLCESHLLPGALIRNDHQKFLCRDQVLRIENTDTAWTRAYSAGDTITVPLKNGEGNFQASPAELERLEGEGRVVFRYVDFNPNGSANDIAGVTNAAGNVVGLMPHPEHATEAGFGPLFLGPDGASHHGGTDGLGIFRSVLASLVG